MRSNVTTQAELEFLRRLPRLRRTTGVRGQVLYLPRTGHVVVPFERHPDRWLCAMVNLPGRPAEWDPVTWVHDAEIETAVSVATVDPVCDPDTFTYAWLARLWPRWPNSPIPELARELVTGMRQIGTVIVDLDEAEARRLAVRHRLPMDGLRRALTNLQEAGLLHHDDSHGPWGEFTLTMPGARTPARPPSLDCGGAPPCDDPEPDESAMQIRHLGTIDHPDR
jgi:hypothetical protein